MLYIVGHLGRYTTYFDENAWGLPRKCFDIPHLRIVSNFKENAINPTILEYIAWYENYGSLQHFTCNGDRSLTCRHCNTIARLSDWALNNMECPFCHIEKGVKTICQ